MKVAFDSNILLYSANVLRNAEDQRKRKSVEKLLLAFPETVALTVPFQVLGECYQVMMRYGYPRERCHAIVLDWVANFETAASSETAFFSAFDLSTDHKLQFWDALILSVAAEAGCSLLLSEDMQEGFSWRGVTIVDPFAPILDRRLSKLLGIQP